MIACHDCRATVPTIDDARAAKWEPSAGWARPLTAPVTEGEPWVCAACLLALMDATLEAFRRFTVAGFRCDQCGAEPGEPCRHWCTSRPDGEASS